MTYTNQINTNSSALIPHIPTLIGVEQNNQKARPDQIATSHDLMIRGPGSTTNKKIQIKINDLLNPVQELRPNPPHAHSSWNNDQDVLITESAVMGEPKDRIELYRQVNDLANGDHEKHTDRAINKRLSQAHKKVTGVADNHISKTWNDEQLALLKRVIESNRYYNLLTLTESVNQLSPYTKQQHSTNAVGRKCSSIRRELGIDQPSFQITPPVNEWTFHTYVTVKPTGQTGRQVHSNASRIPSAGVVGDVQSLSSGVLVLPEPISTPDERMEIVGLQNQHQLANPVSTTRYYNLRWSAKQEDYLIQYIKSGDRISTKELHKQVNALSKDNFEIHTERAVYARLCILRKRLQIGQTIHLLTKNDG